MRVIVLILMGVFIAIFVRLAPVTIPSINARYINYDFMAGQIRQVYADDNDRGLEYSLRELRDVSQCLYTVFSEWRRDRFFVSCYALFVVVLLAYIYILLQRIKSLKRRSMSDDEA